MEKTAKMKKESYYRVLCCGFKSTEITFLSSSGALRKDWSGKRWTGLPQRDRGECRFKKSVLGDVFLDFLFPGLS